MSLSRREVALWALAAAVVCALGVARGLPQVTNDGTQYLSVADHLAAGDGALTSYAHFEAEVARGCPPVAMTTFPPGYPAAAVPLRWLGVDRVWAAAAVSAAAFILLMLVVARLAAVLALPLAAARLALLLTVGSHEMARHAMSTQSELLFTLLVVGAVWATAEAMVVEHTARRRALRFHVVAGVLLGAAYWVRYAALFVLVPLALFHAGRLLFAHNRRGALLALAGLNVTAAIVAVGFLRNLSLSGDIRGGNAKAMAVPLGRVANDTVFSLLGLLVGDENLERRPLAALAGVGLFVAALAVVVFLGRATLRRRPRPSAVHLLLLLIIAFYSAAIIYVGHTSVISLGARMFLPWWPLAVLLLAAALAPALDTRRGATLALAGAAALVLATNLRGFAPGAPQHVLAALNTPDAAGESPHAWLRAHLTPGEPIAAAAGQAVGHALRRPTLSILDAYYAEDPWDEAQLQSTMQRCGARTLVFFPDAAARIAPDGPAAPFFAGLAAGQPPPWLRLAATNQRVFVYQLTTPGP